MNDAPDVSDSDDEVQSFHQEPEDYVSDVIAMQDYNTSMQSDVSYTQDYNTGAQDDVNVEDYDIQSFAYDPCDTTPVD